MLKARIVTDLRLDQLRPGDFLEARDSLGNVSGFYHMCHVCQRFAFVIVDRPLRHQIASRDPLTIVGSILCPIPAGGTERCGAHYWVRDGLIVPC